MKNSHQRIKERVVVFLNTRSGQLKAIIDSEDLPKIYGYACWSILRGRCGKDYVITHPWREDGKIDKNKTIFLHRLLMGVTKRNVEVGFLSGDTFDCRKANLYKGTHIDISQNQKHKKKPRSGINNVDENKGASLRGRKQIYGKRRLFGSFATKAEAQEAVAQGTLKALQEIAAQHVQENK